ncbi:MAG: amidohydrolase [Candidatus Methanomethylicia archaeon]
MVDLIIRNGFLLTMKGNGIGFIEDGAVAIEDGKIIAVGKTFDVESKIGGAEERVDAHGMVIMPGLVNAHVHSYMTIARGECQDVPEIEWMIKTVSPFTKHLTSDLAIKSAKLTVLEGLKTGTTLFADYGPYMMEINSEVHSKMGSRAFTCTPISEVKPLIGQNPYEPYEMDKELGEKRIREALELVKKWHNWGNSRIRCCLGPVAADMLTTETLLRVKELAEKYDLLMHFHMAQGGREAIQIKLRYNTTTVRYLDNIGFLCDRVIGVHCHGASNEELKIMVDRGVRMVSCPTSIALIDGLISPLNLYLELGGRSVGIGTDQANGNNSVNMFIEMKMAAILNKVRHRDPTVLPAWKILKLATIEGARCLGFDDIVGSLEEGKRADIIIVNLKKPNLTPIIYKPIRNIAFNLVYSANGSEVEYVIVDGEILVEKGRYVKMDEEKIIDEAQKASEKLMEMGCEDYIKSNPLILKYARENLI